VTCLASLASEAKQLSVALNGRIDCVWFDSRNAATNLDSQLFYSYITDGGVSWSANDYAEYLTNAAAGLLRRPLHRSGLELLIFGRR
jgi:hypothetical protein